MPDRLPVGRVLGHRGGAGELTVRVPAGDASRWSGTRRVGFALGGRPVEVFEVDAERAYKDRWVLKLHGIDDASAAAGWKGADVSVAVDDAPELGPFEHWHAELVGMTVSSGADELGTVVDVRPTGGVDLLVVDADGEEILVPMHRSIVTAIDEAARTIEIDPPQGLLDLNRSTD